MCTRDDSPPSTGLYPHQLPCSARGAAVELSLRLGWLLRYMEVFSVLFKRREDDDSQGGSFPANDESIPCGVGKGPIIFEGVHTVSISSNENIIATK